MNNAKYEFTITGMIFGLLLIGMLAATFSGFMVEMNTNYNISGNYTLSKYNVTNEIISNANSIENKTNIGSNTGLVDIIGNIFSGGYSALKYTKSSFVLYTGLLDDASTDIPYFEFYSSYIKAIFLMALLIGIFMVVLLKWKV